jgi:hypothetical protein
VLSAKRGAVTPSSPPRRRRLRGVSYSCPPLLVVDLVLRIIPGYTVLVIDTNILFSSLSLLAFVYVLLSFKYLDLCIHY